MDSKFIDLLTSFLYTSSQKINGDIKSIIKNGYTGNFSIDTRSINKGDIFIALKGDNFNGNDFIIDAIEKGALLAICSEIPENLGSNIPFVLVTDTGKFLCDLARIKRRIISATIIGITGSFGKTTTKNMLYFALQGKYACYESFGNYNNHIGLPLNILNMPEDCDVGIFEMGMNHSGEIDFLAEILKPNIGVLTRVDMMHSKNFLRAEDIVYAKSEMFSHIDRNGKVFIDGTSMFLDTILSIAMNHVDNVYVLSDKGSSELYLKNSSFDIETMSYNVEVSIFGNIYNFSINSPNPFLIMNSAIVASIAHILGISSEQFRENIRKFYPVKGRGSLQYITALGKRFLIIDESYNAGPLSMIGAIRSLSNITIDKYRRVIIIGDMAEVNDEKEHYYQQIINNISNIDLVFTVGEDTKKYIFDRIPDNIKGLAFEHSSNIGDRILNELQDNDVILVKGSRSMKLDVIISNLVNLTNTH